jgi:hypothetical protein
MQSGSATLEGGKRLAKANFVLPNGTTVNIEGTAEEIRTLLEVYGGETGQARSAPPKSKGTAGRTKRRTKKSTPARAKSESTAVDISEVVRLVKDCEEAEDIERQILDWTSQVNRTLLPLYIVHEHLDNEFALSSGDINRITTDLGVPVSQPNASSTLSGTASKYVIGDSVRLKGRAVRYKLSRRGIQYVRSVIRGESGENTE